MASLVSFSSCVAICLWQGWSAQYRAPVVCHCDSSVDPGVLELLQNQLARCGPDQLTGQPCPKCPTTEWAASTRFFDICLLGPIFFTFGFFAAKVVPLAGRSVVRTAALALEDDEPAAEPADFDGLRWTPPRGSSARRVR